MAHLETLTINPEAQRLHSIGLQAGLDGEYVVAYKQFDNALQLLATADMMRSDGGLQDNGLKNIDSDVQVAHIVRDKGFTYAREAITKNDTVFFDLAQERVTESFNTTKPIVKNIYGSRGTWPDLSKLKPTRRHEQIISQHGATVSCMARITTARAVMEGVDTRHDEEVANGIVEPYEDAHDLLRLGNNGYYLVSNAMTAARQERLNGNLPEVTRWLARAANGLMWTGLHDHDNIKAATLTAASRVRHLRSHQVAEDSVFVKP